MKREELEKKADKLNLDYDDDTSDEALQKLIEEAEDDDDKNKKDPEYLEKELQKVIKQRQKEKTEKRNLKNKLSDAQKKMKDLEDKMKDLPDKDTLESLNEELENLRGFKEKTEEEIKKKELEDKSEVERLQIQLKDAEKNRDDAIAKAKKEVTSEFEKRLNDLEKKTTKDSKEIEQLRDKTLRGEIVESASKHKALNPEHIYRMLKNEFKYDADLNKFIHEIRDEKTGDLKDYKEVNEYIKEFLDDEENDYLVNADIDRTSFHSREDNSSIKKKGKKKQGSKYDPNDKELQEKAAKEHFSVEDYIDVLEKRDAKLEKVKQAKTGKTE